jgi:WD40 repeat protein
MNILDASALAVTVILVGSGCGEGLDSRPTPVPVYPPGGDPGTGSFCGLFGGGGVKRLAVARDRAVAVVGYGSGRVAAHALDAVSMMIGTPTDHHAAITALAVSGDGSLMASASSGGDIIVAAPGGGRSSRTVKHPSGRVSGLAFSPDATVLVSASSITVSAWRLSDGASLWSRPAGTENQALFLSPDGQTVIAGSGIMLFRRVTDGAVIGEVRLRQSPVITGIASDGRSFVGVVPVPSAPGAPSLVGLWRASDGEPLWTRPVGPRGATVHPSALSPDRSTVAVAAPDGTIRLLRADDGADAGALPASRASALAFAPGDGSLVVGDEEGGVRVLALPGGEVRATIPAGPGHGSPIRQVGFSPDGALFASSSYGDPSASGEGADRSLKVWRVSDGQLLFTVPGAAGPTSQVFAFSPDSALIATVHQDQQLHLVRSSDGQEVAAFGERVRKVAFAPDGRTVLTGCGCDGDRRSLRRWRVADGGEELGVGLPYQIPAGFAFSPDGVAVAVVAANANQQPELELWHISDGTLRWQASRPDGGPFLGDDISVAFSPDAALIAYSPAVGGQAEVLVHRRSDGRLIERLRPKGAVQSQRVSGGAVSFSRDGAWLAAGADSEQGGGLTLYRTATWGPQPPLRGGYLGVAFSPTGDRLLGGGRDRVLRMFCGITGMLR